MLTISVCKAHHISCNQVSVLAKVAKTESTICNSSLYLWTPLMNTVCHTKILVGATLFMELWVKVQFPYALFNPIPTQMRLGIFTVWVGFLSLYNSLSSPKRPQLCLLSPLYPHSLHKPITCCIVTNDLQPRYVSHRPVYIVCVLSRHFS